MPIRIKQIHFLPTIHDPCITRIYSNNNDNNKCTQVKLKRLKFDLFYDKGLCFNYTYIRKKKDTESQSNTTLSIYQSATFFGYI